MFKFFECFFFCSCFQGQGQGHIPYLFIFLKESSYNSATKFASIKFFDEVLGLDLLKTLEKDTQSEIPEVILELVEERRIAKCNKNYSRADEIRKEILKLGYLVEDSKEGVRIKRI